MKRPGKLYFVWYQDSEEPECSFFEQYCSLEEAVLSKDAEPVEVYEASLKSLGTFKAVPQPIKIQKVKVKK